MTPCKWCGRPLEGVGVAACKGRRACACRQAYEEGEEQGRANERAAIVAWLRGVGWYDLATDIEHGEHLPKGKP